MGLTAAGDVIPTWTVAFYDYAEQMLKAQRQFADSVLRVGAPMLDVAQDLMSWTPMSAGRQTDGCQE
jgi:hypothetical protein